MFPEPQKMLANSRLMDRDVIVPERHLGRREIKRLSHAFIVRLQPVGRFFDIFEGGRGLLAAKARHTNSRQHISGNITAEEVFSELKRNYDGFAFDEKASIRVYCPWSVLCFLSRPDRGFQNYWFESGGQPTVLLRYLKNHALQSPIAYKQSIIYSLSGLRASTQYDEIDPEALLLQTGYLTIKSLEGGDFVRLDYPNEEVAVSMARLYAENLLRQDRTGLSGVARLEKNLSTGNLDEIVGTFNRVLTSIDYHRYPIHDESSCRAYLQVLMIGAALIPRVEVHNAFGRSGLEVETGRRHWIFELKYAKKSADASSRLEEALHQTTVRRYGEGDASDKELLRVALVFSEEARAFVAWRLIP